MPAQRPRWRLWRMISPITTTICTMDCAPGLFTDAQAAELPIVGPAFYCGGPKIQNAGCASPPARGPPPGVRCNGRGRDGDQPCHLLAQSGAKSAQAIRDSGSSRSPVFSVSFGPKLKEIRTFLFENMYSAPRGDATA